MFSVLLISCNVDETDQELIPERLFRPVQFTAEIDGTTVVLSWLPVAAAYYSVELSNDSLQFLDILQTFQIEGKSDILIENLFENTRYSARIKAVSNLDGVKDSGYKNITFVTGKN